MISNLKLFMPDSSNVDRILLASISWDYQHHVSQIRKRFDANLGLFQQCEIRKYCFYEWLTSKVEKEPFETNVTTKDPICALCSMYFELQIKRRIIRKQPISIGIWCLAAAFLNSNACIWFQRIIWFQKSFETVFIGWIKIIRFSDS